MQCPLASLPSCYAPSSSLWFYTWCSWVVIYDTNDWYCLSSFGIYLPMHILLLKKYYFIVFRREHFMHFTWADCGPHYSQYNEGTGYGIRFAALESIFISSSICRPFHIFSIIFWWKSQFSYPNAWTRRNSVISLWIFIICASKISQMMNGMCDCFGMLQFNRSDFTICFWNIFHLEHPKLGLFPVERPQRDKQTKKNWLASSIIRYNNLKNK